MKPHMYLDELLDALACNAALPHLPLQGIQARHLFFELADLLFEPRSPRRDRLTRFLTIRAVELAQIARPS